MQYRYAKITAETGRRRRCTPERWLSGPDPYQHELYYAWHKHRSQAHYRGESYELTFEDWQKIWSNPKDFFSRGRKRHDLTLTRSDRQGPWSLDNCEIITRLEQLRRDNALKRGKPRRRV